MERTPEGLWVVNYSEYDDVHMIEVQHRTHVPLLANHFEDAREEARQYWAHRQAEYLDAQRARPELALTYPMDEAGDVTTAKPRHFAKDPSSQSSVDVMRRDLVLDLKKQRPNPTLDEVMDLIRRADLKLGVINEDRLPTEFRGVPLNLTGALARWRASAVHQEIAFLFDPQANLKQLLVAHSPLL